ncbi:genetic suppressor element 1 [Solea solea]|uniref:genetic suppressor element 1 n=1 Tax=Solea solea TaxID=90069 RepID=UPI00272CCD8F|nr:genetic suppressor element 1 [Solea solea]XP_058499854.1 genetic suppressor element 1 [Solea solea]
MNPSPDRSKECLPPKKRESRQGSVEHQITLDEFKPPVPVRSRPSTGRGEGSREASERDRALTNPNPHLLHTPPSLPAPAPCLPLSLPWHLGYSPSISLPLFPGQVRERRGSGSPAWKDDPLSSPLPHSSRWLRGEGSLSLPPSSSSSSASSFKTPFPADSREMWSYVNSGRRDYSSSLFSPSYLFSHPSLYPHDPNLVEARHRYLGKRPNGLDGPGSRTVSNSRPLLTGEYESSRTRMDFSPHSSHTNGGRRHHEDPTSSVLSGETFLSDSHTQEDPDPHSSLQDRHPHGLVKTSSNLLCTSPHPLGPDSRAGRGGLMDPLGATPAEAQIYYSLGSAHHPTPQTYPHYSPSGTPMYNLHREPGPRQHNLRNSPHSPLGPPNSHDRLQRDRERDQERDREKVLHRERGKDKEKHVQHDKDQERDRERERRRDRERDRGRESSPCHLQPSPPDPHPSPNALLPHFTKGSLIELASGRLKRVEELRTEDFLRSADTSSEFHLSTCTVLLISPSSTRGFSHLQVHLTDRNTQELLKVLAEYPFFVQDRGWSSCCPQRTTQLYGLPCRQLMEGDVCLALTPTPTQSHRTHARTSSRAHRTQFSSRVMGESSGSHREEMPPPPPPPPLLHHPPPTAPAPPRTLAAQEQPRPRKRRWSAPDTLPATGTDGSLLDLPHGSKLMKWQ